MRKLLFAAAVAALVFSVSCKSKADEKMPELAGDICNCMSMLDKELSAETRDLIVKASNAADPTAELQKLVMALPDDKKMSIGTEMMKMGELEDKNSPVGQCMKKLEEKYDDVKTMDSDKTVMRKVVKAIEQKNCPLALAIMKLGMREMEKGK
jgi:hypothetical protein